MMIMMSPQSYKTVVIRQIIVFLSQGLNRRCPFPRRLPSTPALTTTPTPQPKDVYQMALALKRLQDEQFKKMPQPELEVVRPAPKKRRSSAGGGTAGGSLAYGDAANTVTAVAAQLAAGNRRASTRAVRPPPRGLPGSYANSSRQMRHCLEIIRDLHQKKHYDYAWPFYEPLNWEALGLVDYPDIIDQPMDLGTVKRKLEAGEYEKPDDFASDVRLICRNCYRYNPPGDDVVKKAQRLSEHFELMYARLPEEDAAGSGEQQRWDTTGASSPDLSVSGGTPEPGYGKTKSVPSSAGPGHDGIARAKSAGASNAATPGLASGRAKRTAPKRKSAKSRRHVDSDSESDEDEEPAAAAARLLESSPHIMSVLQSLLAATGGEPKKKKGKKATPAEQQQAAFLQGLLAATNAVGSASPAPAAAAPVAAAAAPAPAPPPAPVTPAASAVAKRKAAAPAKARAASAAAARAPSRASKSKAPKSASKARRASADRPAPKKAKTAKKSTRAPARQSISRNVHSDDDDSDYSDTEDAPMTYEEKAQLSEDINQVCCLFWVAGCVWRRLPGAPFCTFLPLLHPLTRAVSLPPPLHSCPKTGSTESLPLCSSTSRPPRTPTPRKLKLILRSCAPGPYANWSAL